MDYISTGQAAKMLLVTRDTVLKWIHQGRLPARRTAGGHYRIPSEEMRPFLALTNTTSPEQKSTEESVPRNCWEYFATHGEIKPECGNCLVYKVKGTKCYEVAEFLRKIKHGATCCVTGCEDCSFYREHVLNSLKVVILTKDDTLKERLSLQSKQSATRLKFAQWEYECSTLAVSFRPDFIVVDCVDDEKIEEYLRLYEHIRQDLRNQGIKVVFAAPGQVEPLSIFPRDFLIIKRPFDLYELEVQLKELASSERPKSATPRPNSTANQQQFNIRG